MPPRQEQPALCRRPRCWQDGDRRRPGAPHRAARSARGPAERDDLRARHGGVAGRHPVSRRFRRAAQGGLVRTRGAAGCDPVHRRDSHRNWCPGGGGRDAANLLKPALAGGVIRCIGSTTYKEYRNYFEKDRALVRRFQKIDVPEPSMVDAIEIMKGLKPVYEKHHHVSYTDDAIKAAVELSA